MYLFVKWYLLLVLDFYFPSIMCLPTYKQSIGQFQTSINFVSYAIHLITHSQHHFFFFLFFMLTRSEISEIIIAYEWVEALNLKLACFWNSHFLFPWHDVSLHECNYVLISLLKNLCVMYCNKFVFRYTDRRKCAVHHFKQALSIDPLLWAAYEELCILALYWYY